MNHDISFSLGRRSYTSAVGKRHFTLSSETAEDGNDMFGCLIGFVDDNDPSVLDSAQKGGISVVNDATLQRSRKHQLGDRGISVELDIFPRSAQKLFGYLLDLERGTDCNTHSPDKAWNDVVHKSSMS